MECQYIKPIWAARSNPLVAQMFLQCPLGVDSYLWNNVPLRSMKNALGTSKPRPPENRCPPSREQMPALPRTDACPREGKKYISREQVSAPCQTWDCRSVPRPSSYVIHGLCRLHLLTKLCLFYSCIVTWYCTHSSLVGKTDLLGRGKG